MNANGLVYGSIEGRVHSFLGASPALYRNDLVTAAIYGDSSNTYDPVTKTFSNGSSGACDRVQYTYDRQSEMTSMVDQSQTTHDYSYDGAGRLLSESATVASGNPSNLDATVASLAYQYKVCGKLLSVTSKNSSGIALNQVLYHYDSNGLLDKEYQQHDGAVNTATSLYTAYGYDTSTAVVNGVTTSVTGYRPTTLQYPTSGTATSRVLSYSHGTPGSAADNLNRLDSIVDGSGTATNATTSDTLASYSYLGLGTIVRENYQLPQIKLDYTGSAAGAYSGLDQFNRVVDQFWASYAGSTPTAIDEYKYGYNLQGGVAYKQNAALDAYNAAHAPTNPTYIDQVYDYDYLRQLISLKQGKLVSGTVATGDQNLAQSWTLDGNGNWSRFKQGASTANWTLDQSRTSNGANEIDTLTNTTGTQWAQPVYDPAGNMTTAPLSGETVGLTCTYDAWNRLVHVTTAGASSIDVSYSYDGLGREIMRTDNMAASGRVATSDLYYAGQQKIETRDRRPTSPANGTTAAEQQIVWSARYVDSPILRDRTVSTYSSSTSDWTASTDRLYYLTDANHNVTAVTNASGVVQERYSYDAYGHVTIYNGDWSSTLTASASANAILFAGMDCDPATGLYYDRARWYGSSTGGFLGRDPAQSDANLYRYVGNNPTGAVDPSGMALTFPGAGDSWTASANPATPATPGPNPSCAPAGRWVNMNNGTTRWVAPDEEWKLAYDPAYRIVPGKGLILSNSDGSGHLITGALDNLDRLPEPTARAGSGTSVRFGPWGSFGGTLLANLMTIGQSVTYLLRLIPIPGSDAFWKYRDDGLQDLFDACNIGETYSQTISQVSGNVEGMILTARLFTPAAKSATITKSAIMGETSFTPGFAPTGNRFLDFLGIQKGTVSNIRVTVTPGQVGADLVNTQAHEAFHVFVAQNYPTFAVSSGRLPYIGAFPLYGEEAGAYFIGGIQSGQYGQAVLSPFTAFGSMSAGQSASVIGTGIGFAGLGYYDITHH